MPAGTLLGSPPEAKVGQAHDEMRDEGLSILHEARSAAPFGPAASPILVREVSPWELTWDVSAG